MLKLLLAILLLATPLLWNEGAMALNVQPKSAFKIDTSIAAQADNFNLPDSIVVAPLFLPNDLLLQDSEWYEGIYYYMAVRLGQGDFLAHYIVTGDGTILQGNSKGDEQRFIMNGEPDRPVVILYLAQHDQTDFTPTAKLKLSQLLLSIANRNAIKLTAIELRSLSLLLRPEEPVSLKTDIQGGMFDVSLKQMVTEITPSYKPQLKEYQLKVEKAEAPAAPVNYGDDLQLSLTIKNLSSHVLYQGTDYEPLLSKTGKTNSLFFNNDTWLSQTQAPVMSEGTFLKPGESKTFKVKLQVPLYFGALEESFVLTNALGNPYPETSINFTVNVNKPERTVVEISETETGQLNVRDGPWASSNVITRVTPGQRFFVLERTDSGYTKLDLGAGKTGWVVSRYIKVV